MRARETVFLLYSFFCGSENHRRKIGRGPGGNGALFGSNDSLVWCPLPAHFQCELELTRIVGRGRLASGASRASGRIADLVDGVDVCAIEKIEGVDDQVKFEALAEWDTLRYAHVPSEEAWHGEGVAFKIAGATGTRCCEAGNGERGAAVREANTCNTECHAWDVSGRRAADEGRPGLRRAQVQAGILASDDIKGPAGGDFDDRR